MSPSPLARIGWFSVPLSCSRERGGITRERESNPSETHPLSASPPLQVLTDIRADKGQANDGLSSSLLILYLDSARNLPVGSTVGARWGADFHTAVAVSSLSPSREQLWGGWCIFTSVYRPRHSGSSDLPLLGTLREEIPIQRGSVQFPRSQGRRQPAENR